MEHIVHRRHDDAAILKLAADAHMPLVRERAQKHYRVHRHLLYIHRLRYDGDIVVKTGQVEQLFGRALQPLRLVADVGDELAHGVRIHVVALHDAVRQKPYGRQRRFQLVRRVGDEAAALPLGIVKALGQHIELLAQLRYLVAPGDLKPVLVVPARYDAHRACKRPNTAEQKRKVYGRDNYGDSDDDDGDDPKLRLQVNDYLRALIVPLLKADSAAYPSLPADGDGAACKKALVPERRAKHVLAGRCRYQVVIVGLAPRAGNAVVQHGPLRVRDRNARKTPDVQQPQHLGNALGVGLSSFASAAASVEACPPIAFSFSWKAVSRAVIIG